MKEFNFIKSEKYTDRELFFGPLKETDLFIEIEDKWTMIDIMIKAEIFKSKSDARRNNWNKEIPFGFTDFYAGKYKNRITILNYKEI